MPFNTPDNLRVSIERNLRTLRQEAIQLVHFRVMPGSDVPFAESMGAMYDMQREGKIQHVGVSNVTPEELTTALAMGAVASVENMYGYAQRTTLDDGHGETRGGEVLPLCEQHGIAFVPFFSLVHGLANVGNKMAELARQKGVTEAQLNLAWAVAQVAAAATHPRYLVAGSPAREPGGGRYRAKARRTWLIWVDKNCFCLNGAVRASLAKLALTAPSGKPWSISSGRRSK